MFPGKQVAELAICNTNVLSVYDISLGIAHKRVTFLPPVSEGDRVVCLHCHDNMTPMTSRKHLCVEIRDPKLEFKAVKVKTPKIK